MALTLALLVLTMITPRAALGQGLTTVPDTARLQPLALVLPDFLSPFPGRAVQGAYTVGQIGLKTVPLLSIWKFEPAPPPVPAVTVWGACGIISSVPIRKR